MDKVVEPQSDLVARFGDQYEARYGKCLLIYIYLLVLNPGDSYRGFVVVSRARDQTPATIYW